MPSRPRSICRHPGCHKKTDTGHCPEHRGHAVGWNKTATHPWYNLPVWKGNTHKPIGKRGGLRDAQLTRQPYCKMCKDQGRIVAVTGKGQATIDHIKPFRTGRTEEEQWQLFTDPDNLQTLCKQHNAEKTARDRASHRGPAPLVQKQY